MITKAHTNEIITVEKNVLLKDGTEAEAVITIRKLEGNSWNIVDISTGSFQVTEGTYKYYYTYGNQTKELLLVDDCGHAAAYMMNTEGYTAAVNRLMNGEFK